MKWELFKVHNWLEGCIHKACIHIHKAWATGRPSNPALSEWRRWSRIPLASFCVPPLVEDADSKSCWQNIVACASGFTFQTRYLWGVLRVTAGCVAIFLCTHWYMFGHLGGFGLKFCPITVCHLAHGCGREAMWLTSYSDFLKNLIILNSQIGLRWSPTLPTPQRGRAL